MQIRKKTFLKYIVLYPTVIIGISLFSIYRGIDGVDATATFLLLVISGLFIFSALNLNEIINPYTLFLLVPISLIIYDINVSTHYLVRLTSKTVYFAIYNMIMYFLGLQLMQHTKVKLAEDKWQYGLNESKNNFEHIAYKFLLIGIIPACVTIVLAFPSVLDMNKLKSIYGKIPLCSVINLLIYPGIMFAIKSNRRKTIFIAIIFALLNLYVSFSKSTLLMLGSAILIAISSKSKKNKKRLFIPIIAIAVIGFLSFAFYNKIRFGYSIENYFNEQKYIGNIPQQFFLPYMYIISPWSNVQFIMETLKEHTYGLWAIKPFLGYAQLDFLVSDYYNLIPRFSAFNTYTYMSVFFIDFGFFGSGICSFILGMLVMYIYRLYKKFYMSPLIQGVYALNVYAEFMMFFNNHYLQLSYPITILIIARLINMLSSNKKNLHRGNKLC